MLRKIEWLKEYYGQQRAYISSLCCMSEEHIHRIPYKAVGVRLRLSLGWAIHGCSMRCHTTMIAQSHRTCRKSISRLSSRGAAGAPAHCANAAEIVHRNPQHDPQQASISEKGDRSRSAGDRPMFSRAALRLSLRCACGTPCASSPSCSTVIRRCTASSSLSWSPSMMTISR